ncbi:MAG: PadR family transcriptional regulator [Candidatus Goldbacteria bacterium]|nr:PadR family transcriptional regulator [Candidatus Goldiibacteriota bacterium]
MDSIDKWLIQVKKGIAELSVLNILEVKEMYGYDIAKTLETIPDFDIKSGTIYPLLSRLKKQGLVKTRLVESNEGPVRKYYSLTKEGIEATKVMNGYLESLVMKMKKLRREKG